MMMSIWRGLFLGFLFFLGKSLVQAEINSVNITLQDAERKVIVNSNRLKGFIFEEQASLEHTKAQFETLLPRLNFQGNYSYFATIPQISFLPGMPPINFGTNHTYSVGPTMSYTLWDTFSSRNSYRSAQAIAQARTEDRKNAQIQLLFLVRTTYLQTQLRSEELRLIYDSFRLAQAQRHDVQLRLKAGAASKLDLVTAERSVLSYQIQLKQKQTDLSSSLKDLFSLIGDDEDNIFDISHPAPEGIPNTSVTLKLDSLSKSLTETTLGEIHGPSNKHPQLQSQSFQAEAFEFAARSQISKLFPMLQISGAITLNLPNIPNPPQYWQESVGISLSMPLFLGDPSPHLSAQQRNLSISAEYKKAQLKEDLNRDFEKSIRQLKSLREERVLATRDIQQSEEAAKLYYMSYQAGRINFIDVQNANVQALTAKVNAARLDAQILKEIYLIKSLLGTES